MFDKNQILCIVLYHATQILFTLSLDNNQSGAP